jgi:hypothetical protein
MSSGVGWEFSIVYSESTASQLPQIQDFGGIAVCFPPCCGEFGSGHFSRIVRDSETFGHETGKNLLAVRAFRGSFYRSWCGFHVDRYRQQSKFLACGATPEYALIDTPFLKSAI